jgi:hypothetical protein
MRRLRIVITALMLAVLLAPAFTGVSLAQNPNEDCPTGTTLVAKFNWQGGAGYVFEKPLGNDDVVTITGDETGGAWESLYGIAYVILKGGPGTYIYPNDNFTEPYNPLAFSGSFSKDDLPLVGSGNNPDISNIQFCAGEQGTIIIHKEASFESATVFGFESSIPGYGSFPLVDDGSENADTMTMSGLAPGSYLVFEVVPDNWTLNNIVCDPSGQTNVSMPAVEINLAANDTVECTFTNDPDPGTIIIQKLTDPSGPGEFYFSFTDNIAHPNGFELSDGGQKVFSEVEPGSYTVTEVDPGETLEDAFSLSELVCEDGDTEGTRSAENLDQGQATINLDPGETVTCSFTNKKDEGTAITLVSFTARPRVGAVKLVWETGTEVDNAGFNLYRAPAPGGPYIKVNAALIAAKGDPVAGASYSFLDQRLPPGTYYYKLEDVDFNGVTTLHGPVSATVLPRFRRPAYRPTLPGF